MNSWRQERSRKSFVTKKVIFRINFFRTSHFIFAHSCPERCRVEVQESQPGHESALHYTNEFHQLPFLQRIRTVCSYQEVYSDSEGMRSDLRRFPSPRCELLEASRILSLSADELKLFANKRQFIERCLFVDDLNGC